MQIMACIIDENGEPISDDFVIDNDDFSEVEEATKQYKRPVAIRWSRSTDGQVAYWGIFGTTFKPYYYNI